MPSGQRPDFILCEDPLALALRKSRQKIVVAEAKYVNRLTYSHVDKVDDYRSAVEKTFKQPVYETLLIVSRKTEISDEVFDYAVEELRIYITKLRKM